MKRIANYLIAMAIAVFTLTSCEDVPSPFGKIVNPNGDAIVVDPVGSGTEADPYNVTKVTAVTSALADGEVISDVYTKGYICQIDDIDITGTYGNATYWISDDAEGKSGKYEVYRGYGLGGQKFNETGATVIKVGDLVVIKGNVKNFKGNTPEYDQGSIIVVLNDKKASGGEDEPVDAMNTLETAYTVSQALDLIAALADNASSEKTAYVTGKISQIKTSADNIAKFKNIDYVITDGTKELTVFRGKNIDNTDFTEAGQINVGDEVVVLGKLYKYVKDDGTVQPEIDKGNYIVKLTKGEGGDDPTPPSGNNLLENGDFETWNADEPVNWKSASTASASTLTQSTDVHGGSYAVRVAGDAKNNKRLAYKELTLKAGTYNFSFYAKSTTGDASQCRPGYVPVKDDGKVGTYTYGEYASLNNSSWTLVTNEFKLTEQTVVCLLVMNPKTSNYAVAQDILIDDASLTTADGGIIDSGDTPGGDEPSGDALTSLSVDFKANGQGNWTIVNKTALPEGASYIWSYDSKYGMKASAYIKNACQPSDSWLLSPQLNLANGATMTFKQALNKGTSQTVHVMYTTAATTDDFNVADWKEATVDNWPPGNNWSFIESKATLPAGTKRVAFRYNSTDSDAPTWEIESLATE